MTESELAAIEERAAKAIGGKTNLGRIIPVHPYYGVFVYKAAEDIPALTAALREAWGEIRRLKGENK